MRGALALVPSATPLRKHLRAIWGGTFGLGFHIVNNVVQLILLLGTEPIRLRSKQLPFQFGDLSFCFGNSFDALLGERSQPLQ